ncbi:MAG TPA: phosphotransferase family protein [Acidimicrobiales bacterium]
MADPADTELVALDTEALVAYLRGLLPIGPEAPTIALLHGGRSNLTYRVSGTAESWVVRRPPLGVVAPSANDMGREFTVLRGLTDSDVPVPEAIHLCEDVAVIGAPFLVMSFVEGTVVRSEADAARLGPAASDHARLLVEQLARLHAVDPSAVGLDEFGRPVGYLQRQVSRWWRQWEIVHTRDLEGIRELHHRLERNVPAESRASIVHGDYRIDNVLFDPDGTRITAVLDWEMSTLGDPLSDLATLLVYWDPICAPLLADGNPISGNPAFPSQDELVQLYADAAATDPGDMSFHLALAYFKSAVIAEGIHRRFVDGDTVGGDFARVGDGVEPLVAAGLERLGAGAR